MAGRKKQEVAVQTEIKSEEEWGLLMSSSGVHVIDIYQSWSGPCTSMVGTLRKIKNEMNDPLLNLEIVCADAVESLKKYRGNCEPCFLFVANGIKMTMIKGSNAPLILKTITEQIELEHLVIKGEAIRPEEDFDFEESADEEERKESDDELLAYEMEKRRKSGFETFRRPFTIAIIKPDAMENEYAADIIEEIKMNDIEILNEKEIHMTEEQVQQLYPNLVSHEIFDDLVHFMSLGFCIVLVLIKDNSDSGIVEEWRELIGPPENADIEAPESIRSRFGTEKWMNAVHGSKTDEDADREFKLFFPESEPPTTLLPKGAPRPAILAIPFEVFNKFKGSIINKIQVAGFQVVLQKELRLSEEEAQELYSSFKSFPNFEDIISKAVSVPIVILCLSRFNAILKLKTLLGPKDLSIVKTVAPYSLRALVMDDEVSFNILQGSEKLSTLKKELELFFTENELQAVPSIEEFMASVFGLKIKDSETNNSNSEPPLNIAMSNEQQ